MQDIDTLGGAGFASQRYRFGPTPLHLPPLEYKGISIKVHPDTQFSNKHTANTFTLVLKNTLSTKPPSKPKTPPQPEPDPASLSYEASFTVTESETVHLEFKDFKATYRGREVKKDDPRFRPFHSEKIYEISLMCRSDFGGQKGDFGVIVESIRGLRKEEDKGLGGNGVVSVVWALFSGVWIWFVNLLKGEQRIALSDEEKDPLI